MEKKMFPDSQCVIGYNVDSPAETLKEFQNIEYLKFPGTTHKIGCSNGCIATINAALKYDPDVIVFSHDDVRINPSFKDTVISNLTKIASGEYDAICRKPLPVDVHGLEYYMMEVFCISKKAATLAFKDRSFFITELTIPRDLRGSISPEVFLYQVLQKKGLKIQEKEYFHTIERYNETLSSQFGFVHKNVGQRGWED